MRCGNLWSMFFERDVPLALAIVKQEMLAEPQLSKHHDNLMYRNKGLYSRTLYGMFRIYRKSGLDGKLRIDLLQFSEIVQSSPLWPYLFIKDSSRPNHYLINVMYINLVETHLL